MPFIKRHIQDFISDIANRNDSGIGEGTKLVKIAALNLCENGGNGTSGEAPEVISLRNQLNSLGMANLIAKATGSSSASTSSELAAIPPSLRLQKIKEEHSSAINSGRDSKSCFAAVQQQPPPLSARKRREQRVAKEKARALNREVSERCCYKKSVFFCSPYQKSEINHS